MAPQTFALLVTAAIALAGIAVIAVIYLAISARSTTQMHRRLNPSPAAVGPDNEKPRSGVVDGIVASGKKIEKAVDSKNESARLLMQAGWRDAEYRLGYYASQILVPVTLLGAASAVWLVGPPSLGTPKSMLVLSAAAVMLGLIIPKRVLTMVAAGRVRRMKAEVPLFIHLLVLLFESGLSTRQALASLVRDGEGVLPELGKEFELVLRKLEAGGDSDEALRALSAAMALDDLTGAIDLLRQVDRYGGEVRDPLLELLKTLEERRALDMREMVNKMSGQMTIVMVLFFFPALLIFVAGPAFLGILKALG